MDFTAQAVSQIIHRNQTGIQATTFQSVAIPKIMYTAEIWYTLMHMPEGAKKKRGSVAITCQFESMQRLATTAISGAMRTTATDVMEVHTNDMPADLMLQQVCHHATVQCMSLPETRPNHSHI